jgi:hypothetical protein
MNGWNLGMLGPFVRTVLVEENPAKESSTCLQGEISHNILIRPQILVGLLRTLFV